MDQILMIITAFALDSLLGDPRSIPHPVRGIGKTAAFFEKIFRKRIKAEKTAGIASTFATIFFPTVFVLILIKASVYLGSFCQFMMSTTVIYFSIAAKDLRIHAIKVKNALESGDIELARKRVSFMVGRDTDRMDKNDIIRATVESVAENTVDGVLSPLFWAFVFGPAGAFGYRIINTLDSMFGYKNEKYLEFGWFSAKLDDAANYVPARIGIFCFYAASLFLGYDSEKSFKVAIRDGQKHSSPNSGISEAAVAGSLGIRLGGLVYRNGEAKINPFIGDKDNKLSDKHIEDACRLMKGASVSLIAAGVMFFAITI